MLVPGVLFGNTECDEDGPVQVDKYRLLRQLSLDIWGRVPSHVEYTALDDVPDIDGDHVETMLADEEARNFIRRYHKDLLYSTVSDQILVDVYFAYLLPAGYAVTGYNEGDPDRLYRLNTGLYYRNGFVPCKDEPAEFDAEGEPILEDLPDGTRREGYVMVEPYWAPGSEVKVCALDARIASFASTGAACSNAFGMLFGDCGCGPDLQYCVAPQSQQIIQESLIEQQMRMVERPIEEGRSYFDILTDSEEALNGALIHYYRYLAPMALDTIVQVPPVVVPLLPQDVPFPDETWNYYPRRAEHSGVLTSMGFLLRFMTARARANRFYSSFLCSPFQAPGINLPSPSDPCSNEPDLRERCGCSGCHQGLEPAAAHWARFAKAGTRYLDELLYPEYDPKCHECGSNPAVECDDRCQRFYLIEAGHEKEVPFLGTLKAYVFRDEAEKASIDVGPAGIVATNLANGRLQICAVKQVYRYLYHRDMTYEEEQDFLPVHLEAFEASGYDFMSLVKSLVMDPAYRRLSR